MTNNPLRGCFTSSTTKINVNRIKIPFPRKAINLSKRSGSSTIMIIPNTTIATAFSLTAFAAMAFMDIPLWFFVIVVA
jgi:hypothetical protein